MPARWFQCPSGDHIEISKCLSHGGCPMEQRCATVSFLALAGFDREWKGVSPSSAGSGPRMLYLKAHTNYTIDPYSRTWALLGTGVHGRIGLARFNQNILAEEKLSDEEISGTADCLEEDESKPGHYVLTDHKTWGMFKVRKALGYIIEEGQETVLGDDGKPYVFKSGKKKGQVKTKKTFTRTIDPSKADLEDVELQLNRYRILFEKSGFPISRIQIQAIVRDFNTEFARKNGILHNLYLIPVKRLNNEDVMGFYRKLSDEVTKAFVTGYARRCSSRESWEGRRCDGYCEVAEACAKMSKAHGEKRGII